MSDELETSFHLTAPPSVTAGLMERADRPSALRLAVQLVVLVALASLSAAVPAGGRVFTTVALAMVIAALFAPWHECLHGTAFASRRANAIGAWVTGLVFLASPAAYRGFHFAHHRHTQDPARDPEIAFAPDLLGRWPDSLALALFRLSGIGIAFGKIGSLLVQAFAPSAAWDAALPYLRPEARATVRREAWLVLVWATGMSLVGAWVPVVGSWVQAWWLSHLFLSYWLTTEHTGLPSSAPILHRTHTVVSHPWVRWWTWNMGYHAEHHAWPGVPWFRLPELHARVKGDLPRVWTSYLSVWTRR